MRLGGIVPEEVANVLLEKLGDPYVTAMSTISHCIQTIARHYMPSFLTYMHVSSMLANKQSTIAESLLLTMQYLKLKHTLHVQVSINTTAVQLSHLITG